MKSRSNSNKELRSAIYNRIKLLNGKLIEDNTYSTNFWFGGNIYLNTSNSSIGINYNSSNILNEHNTIDRLNFEELNYVYENLSALEKVIHKEYLNNIHFNVNLQEKLAKDNAITKGKLIDSFKVYPVDPEALPNIDKGILEDLDSILLRFPGIFKTCYHKDEDFTNTNNNGIIGILLGNNPLTISILSRICCPRYYPFGVSGMHLRVNYSKDPPGVSYYIHFESKDSDLIKLSLRKFTQILDQLISSNKIHRKSLIEDK